ncbi:MAG: hypothetical protein HZA50_13960 [Planctomycetes bacterium]|nr:hypothetical protein [Planctomycetota bacterium]
MADVERRYDWITKSARSALIVTMVLVGISVIMTVATMGITFLEERNWEKFAIFSAVIIGEVVAAAWLVVLYGLISMFVSAETNLEDTVAKLNRHEALLENMSDSSKKIVELSGLPDQAKSLIFRDREMEAFRENINANIVSRNYESAMSLIEQFEKKFGLADEASKMRSEIDASRRATVDERIDKAVAKVMEIIQQRDYTRSMREIQRIQKMFPGHPKAVNLPKALEAERTKQKRELLQEYGEAVRRNDVDRGIDLLRELDKYLTPQEGAALQESARGVFKARLHNLGVQFSISVAEGQWKNAIDAGTSIVKEFPNSKMAQEVREKLELVKAKMAGPGQPQPGRK